MNHSENFFDPKATTIPVLRYLVAVAELGHFGRAAEACFVSQPTLSTQLSKWERSMGVVVFDRQTQGAKLTVIGERVVKQAKLILRNLEQLELLATPSEPPFYGPVKVGFIQSLGPYLIPYFGASVAQQLPHLEWPVVEGLTVNLLTELSAKSLDLVVLALGVDIPTGIKTLPLFSETFLAAVPHTSPLAKMEVIPLGLLAREHLLLLDDGHCLRDQAIDVCQLRRERLKGSDYRATSLETLRRLVALGHGVTLLPKLAADPMANYPQMVVRPVDDANAQRIIGLAWRQGDRREKGFQLIGEVMQHSVAKHCKHC